MDLNISRSALKTRITLFTLAIFVSGIWSLSFYVSRMLQEDMQRLLGEQQLSTVTFIAEEVNSELQERLGLLRQVADRISPALIGNDAALQAFLEDRTSLPTLFNAGVWVTRTDGIAVASLPHSAERIGVNYMDRDHILAALTQGKSTIGRPVIGKQTQPPLFAIGIPIRDTSGKVIGSVSGVTDLGKSSFLDRITYNKYGTNGGYFLVSAQHRLIITSTDKKRVMQPFPDPGINPALDRYIDGYEGSSIYVNPFGVEVLGSGRKIPSANWIMGATLPTSEAFAPIHAMQQRMLLATLLLTVLAGALTWWMLRRQFSPMLDAINTIKALSDRDINQAPHALPVSSQDEIGTLIGSFNRLLATLAQRAQALKQSDERYSTIIAASPVPLAINDEHGNITYLNRAFIQTLGYTLTDIPTLEAWWPRAYPDPQYRQWVAAKWAQNMEEAMRSNQAFAPMEIDIRCKNGEIRTCLASASAFEDGFAKTHLIILHDITERKRVEQALLAAKDRLSEAQDMAHIGNWALDLLTGELTWSDEIFRMFEIDPEQVGASYEIFLNAIHPDDRDAVNQAYSDSLVNRTPYEISHRLLMNDGRVKWVHEKCTSDFDAAGKPLMSRGMVQDITRIKQTEQALICARDEAERANQAKSEPLSRMRHGLHADESRE